MLFNGILKGKVIMIGSDDCNYAIHFEDRPVMKGDWHIQIGMQ